MPQTLKVTTDVRLIKKNSAMIMQNASAPPTNTTNSVCEPITNVAKNSEPKMVGYPSTTAARKIRITACAGARKNMDAKGFVSPNDSLRSKTSVSAHRRPPNAAADMTATKLEVF